LGEIKEAPNPQVITLWAFKKGGFELFRFFSFKEVGLPMESSDRVVWDFAQANQMILITANRNMKGDDSLKQTMREQNTLSSLPILTIGNPDRMDESVHRQRCASRLIDILIDLENYLGAGRLFIP
jgi:hypothetical protein